MNKVLIGKVAKHKRYSKQGIVNQTINSEYMMFVCHELNSQLALFIVSWKWTQEFMHIIESGTKC